MQCFSATCANSPSGLLAHLTGHTADTLANAPGLSLWHYRTQTGIEVNAAA